VARRLQIMLPDDVPHAWQHIANVPKTMLQWPTWSEAPPPPARGPSPRGDINTRAADSIRAIAPLGEVGGPGLEGVRLRLTAWPFRREYDLTATLEAPGGRAFVTIARLDAWPPEPHVNTQTRRHPVLRHQPGIIETHHVHRFKDNARLGMRAFEENLPVADVLDDEIQSFRDFVRIVGEEFDIEGTGDIKPPESWRGLLV
jgi:hypothetical protein